MSESLEKKCNYVMGINGRVAKLKARVGAAVKTFSVLVNNRYNFFPEKGQEVIVVPVRPGEDLVSVLGLKGYDIFAVQEDGEQIPFAHVTDI